MTVFLIPEKIFLKIESLMCTLGHTLTEPFLLFFFIFHKQEKDAYFFFIFFMLYHNLSYLCDELWIIKTSELAAAQIPHGCNILSL